MWDGKGVVHGMLLRSLYANALVRTAMTEEENQLLQEYARGIAKILYKNAPLDGSANVVDASQAMSFKLLTFDF